jgi:para-aminobenzoate synthetase component 1
VVPVSAEWPEAVRALLQHERIDGEAPFVSGVLGYIGYEAGRFTERMQPRHRPSIPELQLRRYDGSLAHSPDGHWRVAGTDAFCEQAEWLLESLADDDSAPRRTHGLRPPTRETNQQSRRRYTSSVEQILEHLRAGDSYQVNLAHRVRLDGSLSGIEAALTLREVNPAPFGAYLRLEDGRAILSNSPELFLRVRGARVESEPIKGTASCRALGEDEARSTLEHSMKDQAELTMIVDLVRNDLGKVASPGSVQVGPRRIQRAGPVMHASRRVSADLLQGHDAVDAFTAAFPPGSVTGAPKVRSMEIIDALEPVARGVYTGAIGYFSDGGDSVFNVAIRTGVIGPHHTEFHIGAGIVIESEPEAEWAETHAKGEAWLQAFAEATGTR